MMATYSPVVYDATAKAHAPLAAGQPIDPSHILVSSASGNLLQNGAAGLDVQISNVVSSDPDNLLKLVDGKLMVTFEVDGLLSQEAGNYLRFGNDKGLFVDGNDILSNGAENLIYIDGTDNRIILTRQSLVNAGFVNQDDMRIVSADTGNIIIEGTDGGAYLDESRVPTGVSTSAGNLLTLGADGRPYLPASQLPSAVSSAAGNLLSDLSGAYVSGGQLLSADANNLITVGTDGKVYLSKSVVETVVEQSVVPSELISSATVNNALTTGSDGGLVLRPSDVRSTDVNNAISLGADGKLFAPVMTASSLVKAGDLLLAVDGSNKLYSALSAAFDSATGTLSLLGQSGATVATVHIPTASSVLESVEVVVNPEGQPAGTYLAMTFKKDDGTTETVYVDMSAVSDVYRAGNGVQISNYIISAKLAANGGLEFDADGALKISSSAVLNPVSIDTGNIISAGSDGKAYLSGDLGTM